MTILTLKDIVNNVSPVEKLKVVDFDSMETIYDNLYSIELKAIESVDKVDFNDFYVKSIGSLLDWAKSETFIVVMVKCGGARYAE